jgi:hypothetical protein
LNRTIRKKNLTEKKSGLNSVTFAEKLNQKQQKSMMEDNLSDEQVEALLDLPPPTVLPPLAIPLSGQASSAGEAGEKFDRMTNRFLWM